MLLKALETLRAFTANTGDRDNLFELFFFLLNILDKQGSGLFTQMSPLDRGSELISSAKPIDYW